jgi:2-polyprenyl-6-hydroxyphenyl methylase/3-demethylubiquinone-9 3-methyltransferase
MAAPQPDPTGFEQESSRGARFRFGENWRRFLERLDDDRIAAARRSLAALPGTERLAGKRFLDIGSGSGLFSLAARQMGARVISFDYDPESVRCTAQLRERFFPGDPDWQVLQGSVLDRSFMESIPPHDVVYSWGVLHHTGRMRDAIAAAADRVSPGGFLCIALYRKTWLCPLWTLEKRLYCAGGPRLRKALEAAFGATLGAAWRLKHRGERPPRGMDEETDLRDWLGGYPYESITPRDLKAFLGPRGFSIVSQVVKSEGTHLVYGCNEYLFRRDAGGAA